jgi:hypothetical protein
VKRRPSVALSAAATFLLVVTAIAGWSSAAANTPVPGTAAQVASVVKSSTSIKSIPANLTPSLQSIADSNNAFELSGPAYFASCDAYGNHNEQTHPTPCLFGDTKSTKTIVLVGDSNVGNWAPALNIGLKSAGYRLAVYGFAGCPTPDLTYTPTNDPGNVAAACNKWHAALPPAVRSLHPLAVIAVVGAVDLGLITNKQWIVGFKKLYSQLATGSTARILIGTSPMFPEAIPTCLAAHRDPQTCALHYQFGAGYYGVYVGRDPQIASASDGTLIPTYKWLCSSGSCSPVIGKYLVYADADHLTIIYSEYLATVVTHAVVEVVKGH